MLEMSAGGRPVDSYSFMKSATKAIIFISFALSKSSCALGTPAEVLGNLSAMSRIQFSTTPTRRQKQLLSGLSATSRTYVRAVDGRDFITTQSLLKSEPYEEGSGSQLLISVDDTNLAVDIAMPSRILSSKSDGLSRIDT
jgi:hypothetical protein